MKTNLLKAFAFALVMTPLYNCSIETMEQNETPIAVNQLIVLQTLADPLVDPPVCNGQIPRARIINNGTVPFNYSIYDSSSGTLIGGIYDIMPGAITDWTEFTEGTIIFNLENGIDRDQKIAHLMENCTEITMEIDGNNLLTATIPQSISN